MRLITKRKYKKILLLLILVTVITNSLTHKFHSKIISVRLIIKDKFNYIINKKEIQDSSFKNIIYINFKKEDYKKLKSYRNKALENKNISKKQKKYVDGTIIRNGITKESKIRLKGDNIDHISSKKWSLRIKKKGESNAYSIQHPKTRSYLYEWIIHKCFMESGIITTPYDFAQVYIDSVNMGIYAVEEHFTLKMLKLNKRKAGPILRFNEDIHWEEEQQLNDLIIKDSCLGYNGTGNFISTKISLYDSYDYINKDSIVTEAIDKLNNFRNNEIVISEHFDLNLWAKYFAICEVSGQIMVQGGTMLDFIIIQKQD